MANINQITCAYEHRDPVTAPLNADLMHMDYNNALTYTKADESQPHSLLIEFLPHKILFRLLADPVTPQSAPVESFDVKLRDVESFAGLYLLAIESIVDHARDSFNREAADKLRADNHNQIAEIIRRQFEKAGIVATDDEKPLDFYRDVTTLWFENIAYAEQVTRKQASRRIGSFSGMLRLKLF